MTQETTYESLRADKRFQVEIHERLLELCQKKGIPAARLCQLVGFDRGALLAKIADLLVVELGMVATVVYAQPKLQVLKKRFPGGIDFEHRGRLFKPIKAWENISRETRELEFEYLRVSPDVEIARAFSAYDLRPALYEELLAFGEQYPEEQLRYPIMGLGSVVEVGAVSYIACLLGTEGIGRALRLFRQDVDASGGKYRFLGVKIKR